MQKILEIQIDGLRTVSEANNTEHWGKKHRRHKMQRNAVQIYWNLYKATVPLPCTIRLIRIAPRALDIGDNLPMSLKIIRDAICDCIKPGHAPGRSDSQDFTFEYAQYKSEMPKFYGVKIEIYKNE